jgi:hypothetical protein
MPYFIGNEHPLTSFCCENQGIPDFELYSHTHINHFKFSSLDACCFHVAMCCHHVSPCVTRSTSKRHPFRLVSPWSNRKFGHGLLAATIVPFLGMWFWIAEMVGTPIETRDPSDRYWQIGFHQPQMNNGNTG